MAQTIQFSPKKAAPNAFPDRSALMPIWGGLSIPNDKWHTIWESKLPHSLDEDGLAYVHIPFCANHCVFCGFYRNAWKDDISAGYTNRVIAELKREAEIRTGSGKIQAVYFGGGTPTALHSRDLARLVEACYRYLPLADDCEFTLEGRMSHFDDEKIQAAISAGVNRISIGVQTFDTAIRRRLGRKHSGDEARAYLEKLCSYDVVTVADLIFGLPAQTDEIWQNDIAIASQLPLSGLDTYAFNCYPFLPINRMIEKGAFPKPLGFDQQSQQYAYAVAELERLGWNQVSNNHFAYPNRGERNRYNTLVKSNMPCLAFGSGAGGNFGGLSYQVQNDLQAYLSGSLHEKSLSFLSKHSPQKEILGVVQHDIELGFLDTKLFSGSDEAQKLLQQWQSLSLLEIDDKSGIAHLNTSGRYWSPTLTRKLMFALTPPADKDTAMNKLTPEQKTVLRNSLADNAGQILEMLAMQHQCTFEEVIECLPVDMVKKTEGGRIVEFLQAIAAWDEAVTFIAHTPDAIVEVTGKIPNGKVGGGFYNFEHAKEGGVHGHIYYENCAAIYLLERPFMGKSTVSLNFINRNGGAMFKIFVSRDENGELKAHQIEKMRELMKAGA
ncbi:heme anaerobic degradation radical SAM methyltransferase ChuW/HutW [Kingella kingae]|uniref:heme anaerobic degradation radical SAM methyltransferase ChuW/HutW n=3 Tax=Kingella kingae TaxID=504 RepID=UPI0003FA4F15|nr:heme anaerobic degradation radical SAM methyltransferase ChuW/HutW [Kingella kingae]MDK4538056.1 heme anaerobic degradation radical SAM methyltransferase ChuW/HutW [Kingella kingae]MDK4546983.1 heme anaerobic degradation radical SAM methyltransferase ChuW/HutW [Kingella kingae]MDK4622820.1 heme anaerobic degradation radical SAM methyltransferase ChuW/HutW [Kingella kingae]